MINVIHGSHHPVFTYEAEYDGPPLDHWGGLTPDENGEPNTPQLIQNKFFLGYALTDKVSLGLTAESYLYPLSNQTGKLWQWNDPYFHLRGKKIVKLGDVHLSGGLRFYLPLSGNSRSKNLEFAIRSDQHLVYSLGLFSMGNKSMLRWNRYGDSKTREDFKGFLKPWIGYEFARQAKAVLLFEYDFTHTLGKSLGVWQTSGASLQPGLDWDVFGHFNIRPYFVVQTRGKINLSSSYFVTELEWKTFLD